MGLFLYGYICPHRGLLGCNHLWDASLWCQFAQCIPFLCPVRCCLSCLLCATRLAFFASMLSFCTLAYMFIMNLCLLVSFILQSSGTMDTWSKPTFVLLGHTLLFDNMLVCPFICLACFVCPHLAFFVSMFFACSLYLLCFFLYLYVCLFPCLLHV